MNHTKSHAGTEIVASTLPSLPPGAQDLGAVYASVEGVDEHSYHECLVELQQKAHALGATALIGMQLVQSQFQWNQRTSLLATAIAIHRA